MSTLNLLPKSPSQSPILETPSTISNKTTIIISNLKKDDFVADITLTNRMSVVDRIKLHLLNLDPPEDLNYKGDEYYLNNIQNWTNLAFLNRVIIIFKNENAALHAFKYLTGDNELELSKTIKISLQDNLLSRSKSFDSTMNNSLDVTKDLSNFRNQYNNNVLEYKEPAPQTFDVIKDLYKLGIDISDYNEDQDATDFKSPPTLQRSQSLTKTLFKPDLKIKTDIKGALNISNISPTSPKITLDESN